MHVRIQEIFSKGFQLQTLVGPASDQGGGGGGGWGFYHFETHTLENRGGVRTPGPTSGSVHVVYDCLISITHNFHHANMSINVDPPSPYFYIVKLVFTRVYIVFFFFALKHRL